MAHHAHSVYQPIDPQIISQPASHVGHGHDPFPPFTHHADAAAFQALLHAADSDVDGHRVSGDGDEADREAIDRDLDMLIEPQDEDDDEPGAGDAGGGVRMDTDADADAALSKMDIGNLLSEDGGATPGADRRGGAVADKKASTRSSLGRHADGDSWHRTSEDWR